jgi:stage V sporulation protein B
VSEPAARLEASQAGRSGAGGRPAKGPGNVARLTAVRFLSMVGGFLASVLGARLLGAEGMGVVGTALTVSMLAAVIVSAGLSLSAIYYLSRSSEEPAAAVGRFVLLGGIATVADLLIVGLLGIALSTVSPEIGAAMLMAAPLSAAILAFDLCGAILLGLAAEEAYIWVQAAEALVGLIVTAIVLMLIAATPAGFLGATAAGYVAAAFAAYTVVRRRTGPIRLSWDRGFSRTVLSFGLRGQMGNVLQFLNSRLDLLLVTSFGGLAAAGLYYVAVRISEAVLLVAQAGSTFLYPRVAAQVDRGDTETTKLMVRTTLVVVGLGALGVVLVGEPFIKLAFGASFGEAAWAARIVAVAMLPFAIHRLLGGDLRGRGRPGLVSVSSGLALAATVVLDIALIPPFGITGAAVASLVAYSVAAFALMAFFRRATGAPVRELVPTWRDVRILLQHGAGMLSALRPEASGPGGRDRPSRR